MISNEWEEYLAYVGTPEYFVNDKKSYPFLGRFTLNMIPKNNGFNCICEKQIKMFKLFFEKEDYMFHSQYIEIPYRHMARIYTRKENVELTLECLSSAAKYAIKFDTYDYEGKQESLIARGNIPGGVWWHDGHNRSYDVLDWMETDAIFDFVRETIEFEQTINGLKNTAK